MSSNWKICKSFPSYEVSYFGDVRNTLTGKVLKNKNHPAGYLCVNLWKEKKPTTCLVHRLVAEAFLINEEFLPQVNHKDGNKHNNTVDNLEWCTRSYNVIHAYESGAKGFMNKHGKSSLSLDQIEEIRNKYVPFIYTQEMLSKEYGIPRSTISAITRGYTWKLNNQKVPTRAFTGEGHV